MDGLEALSACNHNITFPFHSHPTFNISIILNQTFHTKVIDRTCFAPMGAIVITNPDEVHSTICDAKTGSTFFTFYISPDVLEYLNNHKPVFFKQKIILDRTLFNGLLKVSDNISNPAFHTEDVLQQLLKRLIVKYGSTEHEERQALPGITQILEEDLFEKFSLEKTAGKLSLDKFRFIRQFKQQTGLTPNNYIILRRIEKCKELLHKQSDLLDIAIKTGFYDATHLCKYFKKITGVTPLVYQNA